MQTVPTQAQIEAWRDVIVQAMACIRGETPEDVSFGEAEDDTFSKLRQVDAEMSAALAAAAEADEFPPDSLEGAYRQGQELGRAAAAEPPMELTKEAPDETTRRLAKIIVAAEAGHGGWKVITNDDGSETAYRNLPAAEAAEQIQVLKTVEAATIKRCAQVAKNTYINPASLLSPQEQIAATIMALINQAPHSFEDNPLDWRRP